MGDTCRTNLLKFVYWFFLERCYETATMTDQDRNRQRDHWQAIAEQLGLGPESEPASSETRPFAGRDRRTPEERAEQPASSKPNTGADLPRQPAPAPISSAEEETLAGREPDAAEQIQEGDAAEAEPDLSSRRRSRRRRDDRHAEKAVAEHGRAGREEETSVTDLAGEEAEERPSRRGRRRGRGRRRTVEEDREESAAPATEEPREPELEDDTEIEELGDFSNWNVPSWNELIASLYRPER